LWALLGAAAPCPASCCWAAAATCRAPLVAVGAGRAPLAGAACRAPLAGVWGSEGEARAWRRVAGARSSRAAWGRGAGGGGAGGGRGAAASLPVQWAWGAALWLQWCRAENIKGRDRNQQAPQPVQAPKPSGSARGCEAQCRPGGIRGVGWGAGRPPTELADEDVLGGAGRVRPAPRAAVGLCAVGACAQLRAGGPVGLAPLVRPVRVEVVPCRGRGSGGGVGWGRAPRSAADQRPLAAGHGPGWSTRSGGCLEISSSREQGVRCAARAAARRARRSPVLLMTQVNTGQPEGSGGITRRPIQ
jgi:hypothetical protein